MTGRRLLSAWAIALALLAAAPGVARAGFVGADGRIVFVGGRDSEALFTVAPSGARLAPLQLGGSRPTWSPDGSTVAFAPTSGFDLEVGIWTFTPGQRDSLVFVSRGAEPAWAPDGSRLAFSRDGAVWTMRRDGSEPRRLRVGGSPAWSPDGRRIAFVDSGDVWLMGANGGNLVNLTRNPIGLTSHDPAWRPDGGLIAFETEHVQPSDCGGFQTGDIETIRPDGSGRASVPTTVHLGTSSEEVLFSRRPAWSPRGTRLAVQEDVWFAAPECGLFFEDSVLAVVDMSRVPPVARLLETGGQMPDWQPRCTVRGTPGDDVLVGTPGRDLICAGAGDDAIFGGGGLDVVFAGGGNDVVRGGTANDVLVGGPGADRVLGGPGRDRLNVEDGVSGNDSAAGDAGTDTCLGDPADARSSCP